jgi:hypothetical protein
VSSARERVAKNEAVFREVNERIYSLSQWPETRGLPLHAVCECSQPDCFEQLPIEVAAYEAIRAEPTWFLVITTHVDPELERVVQDAGHYSVVEKHTHEKFFLKTDPRGDD